VFGTRGVGALIVVLMFGLTIGTGLAKPERISGLVGRIMASIPVPARLNTSGRTASIESREVRFRSKCGDRGEGLIATSVDMRDGFFDNE
jgi:hypothetical protein